MELINIESYQLDLEATKVTMVTLLINLDTEIGTIGGKSMGSCVEMIKIVTGLTTTYIVETAN